MGKVEQSPQGGCCCALPLSSNANSQSNSNSSLSLTGVGLAVFSSQVESGLSDAWSWNLLVLYVGQSVDNQSSALSKNPIILIYIHID